MVPIGKTPSTSTLRWTVSFQDLCSLGFGIGLLVVAPLGDQRVQIGAADSDEPSRLARPKTLCLDPTPTRALAHVSELRRFGYRKELVTCPAANPFENLMDHVEEGA